MTEKEEDRNYRMADVVCNEQFPSVQDDLVDGIQSHEQTHDRPHPILVNWTLTYTVFMAAGQHIFRLPYKVLFLLIQTGYINLVG